MKRFLNLIVYILSVHLSALIITGLFRGVLFISSYHQLTAEALSDKSLSLIAFIHGVWFDNVIGCYILLLPLTVAVACGLCNCYGRAEALSDKSLSLIAFIHGVWFDNVIGCYILLLPLTVAVACGLCNCYGRALFRFFTIFFGVFYGLVYLISAADIPYFAYFFKHINSSIFEWFGYAGTTAGMILGETSYYLSIALFLLFLIGFVVWIAFLGRYFRHRCLSAPGSFPCLQRSVAGLVGLGLIGLCVFGIRGRGFVYLALGDVQAIIRSR